MKLFIREGTDEKEAIQKTLEVNEPEATVECFLGCPKSNDLMKKYMRKHYRRTR